MQGFLSFNSVEPIFSAAIKNEWDTPMVLLKASPILLAYGVMNFE